MTCFWIDYKSNNLETALRRPVREVIDLRHLHTHRAAWLGRCLTWMLLLSAVLAGGTGWARALYLYSDSNASAAALDESHPGIIPCF